ncbi:MAG: 3-oxoacyl-[acyl-carrier-protein] reductase [Desulfitobacteriaceae bacterium]|nr:3-oxoacyl-[acyl-carrier-protein] reductase [Desulfitobacteriaceae bacterium]MDD4753856.1 3-oxoacyl-[acyl-carrier-protein] reductase [Desulfitobacteriaceae bacterium]
MSLEERVALITGSSRGIGRAIALELAKNGCRVALNYFNAGPNEKEAREVVELIKENGGQAEAFSADVTQSHEVEAMARQVIEHFGRVDILVNNAGITRDSLLLRMKEDDWDRVLETNLKGTYNCAKYVLKFMMKQRYGRIVNIASVVGIMGNAGQTNYAASKAGVIGFTKSLAREVASRNITVNAVAPGFIDTSMTGELSEDARQVLLRQIPLQRLGTPEDVARLVGFLVSDYAAYITGQTIAVDGGMVMN